LSILKVIFGVGVKEASNEERDATNKSVRERREEERRVRDEEAGNGEWDATNT